MATAKSKHLTIKTQQFPLLLQAGNKQIELSTTSIRNQDKIGEVQSYLLHLRSFQR